MRDALFEAIENWCTHPIKHNQITVYYSILTFLPTKKLTCMDSTIYEIIAKQDSPPGTVSFQEILRYKIVNIMRTPLVNTVNTTPFEGGITPILSSQSVARSSPNVSNFPLCSSYYAPLPCWSICLSVSSSV